MPRSVGTVGRGLVVEVDWVVRHDFFNGGSEGEFKLNIELLFHGQ